MGYAEVSVNSPLAGRRTFSYKIPDGLEVEVGQAVWVPFGDKQLQGIVMELSSFPAVAETREISGLIEERYLLSPPRVRLARWLSEYYLAPLFAAVALMLPPAFRRRVLTYVSRVTPSLEYDAAALSVDARLVWEKLSDRRRVWLGELEKALGRKKARDGVAALVRAGLAVRSYELEAVRVKPKIETCLRLAVGGDALVRARDELIRTRARKQLELLDYLAARPGPVAWPEVRRATGLAKAVTNALAAKGIINMEEVEVRRAPLSGLAVSPGAPLSLTAAQQAARDSICKTLVNDQNPINKKEVQSGRPDVFLLHGVTGSGKTEVYLQALVDAVREGRRGIVMVPEIALTPQTIERFTARFPGRVALLHSGLSLGEQFDEWQRIRNGDFDVVIGSRSVIFAPQPDLGLIIIDEEHEWTYKQTDNSPRYDARRAALELASLTGAVVVLGSATPDIESYYRAEQGFYKLLSLPERVVPVAGGPLPDVSVIDMRKELREGNRSIFSRPLAAAVEGAIGRGEQVILFLNRRGGATFVQCRSCGYVLRCKRCSVPLSYHFTDDRLVCHQCNYQTRASEVCPQCGSRRIKYLGIGTQKLEQEAARSFAPARLLRWDSDAVSGRAAHEENLRKFRNHQADILIGTQMIAKGLDIPRITVVGVVNADISLNLPDFRAGERTFQLLSQVLGRAGRGAGRGQVFIQTYHPEHYAIQTAAHHSYQDFYDREIAYRRELGNPPFSRLATLTYHHANDDLCRQEAMRMREKLATEARARGIAGLSLIGPAPAFVPRRRGKYRWQIILRGPDPAALLAPLAFPPGWTVDIDPVGIA